MKDFGKWRWDPTYDGRPYWEHAETYGRIYRQLRGGWVSECASPDEYAHALALAGELPEKPEGWSEPEFNRTLQLWSLEKDGVFVWSDGSVSGKVGLNITVVDKALAYIKAYAIHAEAKREATIAPPEGYEEKLGSECVWWERNKTAYRLYETGAMGVSLAPGVDPDPAIIAQLRRRGEQVWGKR